MWWWIVWRALLTGGLSIGLHFWTLEKPGKGARIAAWHEVLQHYALMGTMHVMGWFSRRACARAATAKEEQRILDDLISAIGGTVAGRHFGVRAEGMTLASWRELVPLTTYEDYESFIRRTAEGEANVLTKKPLKMLGTTSGTGGNIRVLPMTKKQAWLFFYRGVCNFYYTMHRALPASWSLQRSCKIMAEPHFTVSQGGLLIGPNSSAPSNSGPAMVMYASPKCVYSINGRDDALFLHALFALRDSNLGVLEANFISTISEFMVGVIQQRRVELVHAIATGELPSSIVIEDPSIRERVKQELRNTLPERAKQIELELSQGSVGLIPRLWPRMYAIISCDTGSFEIYRQTLDPMRAYVPVVSPFLAATEGLIGVATNLFSKHYSPAGALLLEFISEGDSSKTQPPTVLMCDLKQGQNYEVVITTFSGLVRYRLGDVVCMEGWDVGRPLLKFLYRISTVIDLKGERTTEAQIWQAVSGMSNWCVADYAVVHHVSVGDPSLRYHIFVELQDKSHSGTNDEAAKELDHLLAAQNAGYRYHRELGTISGLRLHFVSKGTFTDAFAILRELSPNVNQLKMPRLVRNPRLIDLFHQRSVVHH